MARLVLTISLLIFGIFLTTTKAQSYSGPQEDIDAILAQAAAFSQYFVDGDMESIVASYTADGKIFPTGKDIMEGHEALAAYWTRDPDMKALHHKLTPLEIVVTGDRATDYGYYEGSTQYKDNPVSNWKGKYVVIWQKVDGVWKMDVDIWNAIRTPREPSIAESEVRAACMDYIDAFYQADTTLAYRSISPTLRKVGFYYDEPTGKYSHQLEMPFEALVSLAKTWNAAGDKADENSIKRVDIFEVADKTATAKVTAAWGIDYISLAKLDDKWMIINVLWQSKPRQ